MLLAVDHRGLRHLLIPAKGDDEPPKKPAFKGLDVTVDELQVAGRSPRRYFDVACQDASMHPNFTAVAREILAEAAASGADIRKTLERIFARWRWFWGSPPIGMSDEQIVGLFGELWFLEYWLDPVTLAAVNAWTGPTGDRHDFKWSSTSVEVKATRARRDGSASHRISTLDQLEDSEQGQLYLFSLRVTPDPIGFHSLSRSIDRLHEKLQAQPEASTALDERIGVLGYSPALSELYDQPFRVVAEELYRVDAGFPRLTRDSFASGIPSGVDAIAYTLDLAACAEWRVATEPGELSMGLRDGLEDPPGDAA